MALLNILTVPNPLLRQKSQPVDRVDETIRQLMHDLYETMVHKERGVGLAAIQVGIAKRVLVMDWGRDMHEAPYMMANPEIVWRSENFKELMDACLSVPDQYAPVQRCAQVVVRYLNIENKEVEETLENELAFCVQHEIDHLDGKLFIDYLSPTKKKILFEKAVKSARHPNKQKD